MGYGALSLTSSGSADGLKNPEALVKVQLSQAESRRSWAVSTRPES